MVYANTPEVVEALKGIDVLLMVSARENPERVEEHKSFLDAAKLAGVQHIVYTSFYGADEKATFTLSRDHASRTTNFSIFKSNINKEVQVKIISQKCIGES